MSKTTLLPIPPLPPSKMDDDDRPLLHLGGYTNIVSGRRMDDNDEVERQSKDRLAEYLTTGSHKHCHTCSAISVQIEVIPMKLAKRFSLVCAKDRFACPVEQRRRVDEKSMELYKDNVAMYESELVIIEEETEMEEIVSLELRDPSFGSW